MTKTNRWFFPIILFYIVLFLFGTEGFLISPILPVISSDLAVSIDQAAYATAAYVLAYAAAAPPLAGLADRIGCRFALTAGLVLFTAGNVLAAYAPCLWVLLLARTISGLGGAFAGPAVWALIAGAAPEHMRSRAFGLGMASFSLGQAAGVPVGGFVAASLGWRAAFVVIAVLSAGALAGSAFSRTKIAAPSAASRREGKWNLLTPWLMRRTAVMLTVVVLFQAGSLGAYAYLGAMFAERFSFAPQELGMLGTVVGIGSVAGSLLAGRLGDRARRNGFREAGRLPLWIAVLALSLLGASWSMLPLPAVVFLLTWFVASGAFVTDGQTILIGALPQARALASAWNTTSMHAGTAAGVFILDDAFFHRRRGRRLVSASRFDACRRRKKPSINPGRGTPPSLKRTISDMVVAHDGAWPHVERKGGINMESWILRSNLMTAQVNAVGAMFGRLSVRFGSRQIAPLALAPWHADPERLTLPPILQTLQGEWPCVPFGVKKPLSAFPEHWVRNADPHHDAVIDDALPHGFSSNAPWRRLAQTENEIALELVYPGNHAIDRLRRRIVLDDKAPGVRFELEIHPRRDVALPLGLHPTFSLSPEPRQTEIVCLRFAAARTYPLRFEPSARLALDAVFHDLAQAPRADGGFEDIRRLPFPEPREELVQLLEVAGEVAVVRHDLGCKSILSWDAKHFPHCCLWISNRGRDAYPWLGRHLALGVEPTHSFFDLNPSIAAAESGGGGIADLRAGQVFHTRYALCFKKLKD